MQTFLVSVSDAGTRLELPGRAVTLGRRADVDLTIEDTKVSGLHCRFVALNDVWHVEDCASRNGTQLNGAALETRVALVDGDELAIGRTKWRFTVVDPDAAATDDDAGHVAAQETSDPERAAVLSELDELSAPDKPDAVVVAPATAAPEAARRQMRRPTPRPGAMVAAALVVVLVFGGVAAVVRASVGASAARSEHQPADPEAMAEEVEALEIEAARLWETIRGEQHAEGALAASIRTASRNRNVQAARLERGVTAHAPVVVALPHRLSAIGAVLERSRGRADDLARAIDMLPPPVVDTDPDPTTDPETTDPGMDPDADPVVDPDPDTDPDGDPDADPVPATPVVEAPPYWPRGREWPPGPYEQAQHAGYVAGAVESERAWLVSQQAADGSFCAQEPPLGAEPPPARRLADTAISLFALLRAGYAADHPAIARATRALQALAPERPTTLPTATVAWCVLAVHAMGERVVFDGDQPAVIARPEVTDDLRRLQRACADDLAGRQRKTGGWGSVPDASFADTASTRLALQALAAARFDGVPVRDTVFGHAAGWLTGLQQSSGAEATDVPIVPDVTLIRPRLRGVGYARGLAPTTRSTADAVIGLAVTLAAFPVDGDEQDRRIHSEALRDAIAWLDANWEPTRDAAGNEAVMTAARVTGIWRLGRYHARIHPDCLLAEGDHHQNPWPVPREDVPLVLIALARAFPPLELPMHADRPEPGRQ